MMHRANVMVSTPTFSISGLLRFRLQHAPSKVSPINTRASVHPLTAYLLGPSFKRGPPKGYIHSIEQRWHQVECILATIMESPRTQDVINDLRTDPFANAILDRVQTGPYVRPVLHHSHQYVYRMLFRAPETDTVNAQSRLPRPSIHP